jgi:hypothetical protein
MYSSERWHNANWGDGVNGKAESMYGSTDGAFEDRVEIRSVEGNGGGFPAKMEWQYVETAPIGRGSPWRWEGQVSKRMGTHGRKRGEHYVWSVRTDVESLIDFFFSNLRFLSSHFVIQSGVGQKQKTDFCLKRAIAEKSKFWGYLENK